MTSKSRLTHLRQMVAGAEQRMASPSCSDQNFAVLGRMRAEFLAQIEDLGGGASATKETGLSDFEKRLREREQRAAAAAPRAAGD